jgi:hypothetical protein
MTRNTEGPIFKRAVEDVDKMLVILNAAKDPRISPASPQLRVPHLRVRSALRWALTIAVLALFTHPAHAQGCVQCLDSTRATPPAVQAAYRHAIELLGGFGVTLFLAGLLLLRRDP